MKDEGSKYTGTTCKAREEKVLKTSDRFMNFGKSYTEMNYLQGTLNGPSFRGTKTCHEVVLDAPVLTNRTVRVVVENHRGHRVVTEEPSGTGDT